MPYYGLQTGKIEGDPHTYKKGSNGAVYQVQDDGSFKNLGKVKRTKKEKKQLKKERTASKVQ
jgi:hypothetical protein